LVERALRFEINERISGSGEIVAALDESELEAVAGETRVGESRGRCGPVLAFLPRSGPRLSAKRFLQNRLPHCFVTASHELSQEYRASSSAPRRWRRMRTWDAV